MASSPEFQVEDQTDEDFFNKLVGDDEFGLTGSGSVSGEMATALSSMSIGDMGTPVDSFEVEEKPEAGKVPLLKPHEKGGLVLDESACPAPCGNAPLDESVQSSDPVEAVEDVGSPGSPTTERSVGPKGTSVKEVQWCSFSSGQGQLDMDGFGSCSEFFSGVPVALATQPVVHVEAKEAVAGVNAHFSSFELKEGQDDGFPIYSVSSEQLDAQAYESYGGQNAAGNDSQYWNNSFPGWKYDANTGQWYQVDSFDNVTDMQVGGYGSAALNSQEGVHVGTLPVDAATVHGQISQFPCSQQMTQSALEPETKYCMAGDVSNWNQDSYEKTEYPPNMVFDPQYPGWYYDTNTLEWYSLESYTQTLQTTSNVIQCQQTEDADAPSNGFFSEQKHTLHDNVVNQSKNETLGSQYIQEQGDLGGPAGNYPQHNFSQPEQDDKSGSAGEFSGSQIKGSFYCSPNFEGNSAVRQMDFPTTETVPDLLHARNISMKSFATFAPVQNMYQFNQPKTEEIGHANMSQNYFLNRDMGNCSQQFSHSQSASFSQFPYTPNGGRSLEGRPPHALVTFGFGGKLIVMKDYASLGTSLTYGSENATGREVSVLNLTEVVMEKTDSLSIGKHHSDYFHTLCKQTFPGPLVGGNAGNKDLNNWIDKKITNCGLSTTDFRESECLWLLFSLLKIFYQHYGKLRSPFNIASSLQETDGPELAVNKLFSSARKNGEHLRENGAFTHCIHNLPSEGQLQSTAIEVQRLLVSGRRKEALQCAQEGQLWGPAIVLAAQLGDKFYVDSVKQMAHQQFVSGSPLRTLCLLIAGQPADVFSSDISDNSPNGIMNTSQQPMQVSANGMLEDWEENLAVITANRTKDDELVIIHLGDCLWKERSKIISAHTCYLVAEADLEAYSDKARMCLIGADHWKCPRTYACPDAIQRTEFYEYSKVLGNSQCILLPFQPYKLVYAYMLAEVGKIQESLKYCQAMLKLLKNAGRTSEVETLKVLVSSLEERLRTHLQGGYGTNLATAKLVGKIFNSIDRSLHRMIGAPPQSLPPIPSSNLQTIEHDNIMATSKVGSSQSTMAMSSLAPSASVETIHERRDGVRKTMHNRSISEPDFGRSSKQVNPSKDDSFTRGQRRTSGASSRFGLFGSQIFQKTVGWMSRSRQAKLGESNKFYYDEKLKRWVEEGAEPPQEAALPPPPTFQSGIHESNINNGFITQNLSSNGVLETETSKSIEYSPGIPPIPPSQNQFSSRGRMGVRSRYVDTFNKGGGMPTNLFQSPSLPSVKPLGGAKLFIPTPVTSGELTADFTESTTQEASSNEDSSASFLKDSSFSSLSSSSSFTMQHLPSMENISPIKNNGMGAPSQDGKGVISSRARSASWNGNYSDVFNHKVTSIKQLDNGSDVPSSAPPDNHSPMSSTNGFLHTNGNGYGDDLHEVEL